MSLFQAPAQQQKTPTYLKYESVMNCCGAGWMCYFPEPRRKVYDNGLIDDEGTVSEKTLEIIKEDLEIITKKLYSLTLIVLTDKQKTYYEPYIKDYGFKPVLKDVYHTYAGNLLTVYAKQRYKKKKDGTYVDTLTGEKGDPIDFSEDYGDPDYN